MDPMRALVLTEYGRLEVKDVPAPQVGAQDVLIRVQACGICGSDVHGYHGSTGRRRPPIVMGHEAAGTVQEVGRDVAGFRAGDRVTFDSTIYDPESFFSKKGLHNLCDNRRVLGVSCEDYRRDGAFAELVSVPAHIVYRLPEGMAFEQAAMVEPVAVALHARNLTPIAPGDSALVIGAGLIGLMTLQVLKHSGAARILVADVDEGRLALARELGAHATVNSATSDLAEAVRGQTGGRGVDVVLDAVGLEVTVRAAIDAVRKGGAVTLVGNQATEVKIPLQVVIMRQLRLQGSCAVNGENAEALELISAGKVQVDRFISATALLEEAPAWFERLHRREPGLMKVVLRPNG